MVISLGEMIRLERRRHNMTQKQLAYQLGLSVQAVSRYENNEAEPDLTTLKKLAWLFHVDLNYLLDFPASENLNRTPLVLQNGDVDFLKLLHRCSREHQRMLQTLALSMSQADHPPLGKRDSLPVSLVAEADPEYQGKPVLRKRRKKRLEPEEAGTEDPELH